MKYVNPKEFEKQFGIPMFKTPCRNLKRQVIYNWEITSKKSHLSKIQKCYIHADMVSPLKMCISILVEKLLHRKDFEKVESSAEPEFWMSCYEAMTGVKYNAYLPEVYSNVSSNPEFLGDLAWRDVNPSIVEDLKLYAEWRKDKIQSLEKIKLKAAEEKKKRNLLNVNQSKKIKMKFEKFEEDEAFEIQLERFADVEVDEDFNFVPVRQTCSTPKVPTGESSGSQNIVQYDNFFD